MRFTLPANTFGYLCNQRYIAAINATEQSTQCNFYFAQHPELAGASTIGSLSLSSEEKKILRLRSQGDRDIVIAIDYIFTKYNPRDKSSNKSSFSSFSISQLISYTDA